MVTFPSFKEFSLSAVANVQDSIYKLLILEIKTTLEKQYFKRLCKGFNIQTSETK